ncbi:MAG: hypothetical protein WCN92_06930, partial [Eubacteriales bacterium]
PVKAYIHFVGSTEGIILFFRYLFVVFQSTISAVIYWRLRKYGSSSILAAIIYCLHIPLTFMALSYNSMGLAFVGLTGLLMATTNKFSKITFYVIGLLTACAVLCNPVFALVYLLYSFCMIIYELTKNKKPRLFKFSEISFSIKTWFWITFGIFTITTMFFVFLFSRTNLKEILTNLPMLFTDPSYQFSSKDGGLKVFSTLSALLVLIKSSPYLFSANVILTVAIAFDKKRTERRPLYLSAASIIFVACIVQIILSPVLKEDFFFWMFPLAVFGFICFVLIRNKDKGIFIFLWVLGVLYAFCLDIASNFSPWSSTFGLAVSDMASVIFIKTIIDELRSQNEEKIKLNRNTNIGQKERNKLVKNRISKAVAIILVSTLFFQIGLEFYIDADLNRYSQEYFFVSNWPSNDKLDTTVENGPLKGLKSTAYTVNLYNEMINDLDIIKEASKKQNGNTPVFISGYYPWAYLYLELPYATYGTGTDVYGYTSNNRLAKYYNLHPQKTPKYIYVPKMAKINIENMPQYMNKVFLPGDVKDIVAYVNKNYICSVLESDVGYIFKIMN